jgi:hypothetical protein
VCYGSRSGDIPSGENDCVEEDDSQVSELGELQAVGAGLGVGQFGNGVNC